MRLIPDSAGFREGNDKHEPKGTPDRDGDGKGDGGRFARKDGSASGTSGAPAPGTRLSPEEKATNIARAKALRLEWTRLNDALLRNLDPLSPAAKALAAHQQAVIKELFRLDCDPGTLDGIGLPGGPRDMLIIGAGPGGLSAAAAAAYEGLDVLVVDKQANAGGQAKFSSRIENLTGHTVGIAGPDLAARMLEQATRLGAQAQFDTRVVGIDLDRETGMKTVTFADGTTVQSRVVVMAGGADFQKVTFPGSDDPENAERIIYGNAEQIERESAGKPVVLLGGSNGAAQAALGTSRTASHVTVLSRSPIERGMSASQVDAVRANGLVTVVEQDQIASYKNGVVTTKKGVQMPAHRLGVFLGGASDTAWVPEAIQRDARGKLITDGTLATSMEGVFAIGDIRSEGGGRVAIAVGDGVVAAKHFFSYIETLQKRPKQPLLF